jgi:Protein of unknown function (DUF2799)
MQPTTILLAASLSLAGCASVTHMSDNQCRAADWYQVGERDGLSGGPARIDTYAYQCDKLSVQVTRDRYMEGWYEGNALYVHRTAGMEAS